ncbi:MAG: iron-sulfur cluster assembly accessory protein [Pseudomonadota bacterium]
MSPDAPPVTLTEMAKQRILSLMAKADDDIIGLKLEIKGSGCAGLAYKMDYAHEGEATSDVIDVGDARLFIAPDALMFLIGCEIDFTQEELGARFVFNNPNEVGRCGCGESFYVET